MLYLIAALALANPFLTPWDKEKPEPVELKNVVVVGAVEAQAGSGFFAVWNRIDIRTADGKAMSLFEIHMDKGNPPVPAVGATCDFTYRMGQLGGSLGPGLDTTRDWPMVEKVACQPA